MEEKALFNLEEYKEQLIKCYSWGCDKDKNLERQQYINLLYSDEFLKGIIKNTQEFIFTLIKKMNEERRIYSFDIFDAIEYPEGKNSYLTNGCMGGWFCDEIFSFTENGPLISMRLINTFFGKSFRLELDEDIRDVYCEKEDAGHEYSVLKFQISGPVENFDAIYANYFSNEEKQLEKIK